MCVGIISAETGQDNSGYDSAPGPGMAEHRVNNDVTVLMPDGSKMRKRNESTQIMEGIDEYAARKFVDINKRFGKLEKDIMEIKEAILYLKAKLNDVEKSTKGDLPKDAER